MRYKSSELKIGTKIEMEHTDDPSVAERIAKDHLDEDPMYYTHLAQCGMLHNGYVPNFRYGDWGKRGIRWYHGTGRDYGEAILKDGYVRAREEGDYTKYSGESDPALPLPGRVYVSSSAGVATKYGIDGTMYEKWDAYEPKYCYVFEVELGEDVNVLLDEDLIGEKNWVLTEAAGYVERSKVPDTDDRTVLGKAITLALPDDKAIDITDRLFIADGYVNLAVKSPAKVLRAWRYDLNSGTRGTIEGTTALFKDKAKEVKMDMERNGWGEYVRGEYWYYEGTLYEADSNEGKGHEQIAQDLLIDMGRVRDVAKRLYARKGINLPDWLDDETEGSEALVRLFPTRKPLHLSEREWEGAWREAIGDKLFEAWRAAETKGRFLQGENEQSFCIELLKKGGVRIINEYIQVWKLTSSALESAQQAIWEIMQDTESAPGAKVVIEEISPELRSVTMSLDDFIEAKSTKQVWDSAAYANNPVFSYEGGGARAVYYKCRDGYAWVGLSKNESHESFSEKKGRTLQEILDAGGITQWDGSFHVAYLTKRTKAAISDRLRERPLKGVTEIDVHEQRGATFISHANIPIEDAIAGDFDGATKYLNNGSKSYYVWVIDDEGNYIDLDGVSGPHELANAREFARIAAKKGYRGRVVTKGSDPLAKSFAVVDVYGPGRS